MDNYTVEILSIDNNASDEGYRKYEVTSKRKAEKLESGILRNLNHNKYYTLISCEDPDDEYYNGER